MKSSNRQNLRTMTQSAIFAALLCVLSPIAIPVGAVPITLSIFLVMLTGVVLEWRQAGMAVLVYLLIGAVGLPVFSGGQAGFAVFIGPTGGYLWCYLPMVILISMVSHCGGATTRMAVFGNALALVLCYTTGTAQFTFLSRCDIETALAVCVFPFVALDVIKLVAAAVLGNALRLRLQASGLMK